MTVKTTKDSKTQDAVDTPVRRWRQRLCSPGTICDIRNVYQTKPDENGETTWTKDFPKSLVAPVEDAESAQYAVIVRNSKCYDGRKSLKIHSIVVQSEPLKEFLGKVLEGYPGVTTTLERLEFNSPFKPMVHRWENFLEIRAKEQDPTTKQHADLLHKILEEELRDTITRKNDLIRNKVITHELVWSIFEPGDVMIHTSDGRTRAFIFDKDVIDGRSKAWTLTGKYVDHDGENFGYRDKDFEIYPFIGTVPITSLAVSPLKYHADQNSIRESLIARGKLWEEHKGYHYKQYRGIAHGFNHDVEIVKYHVNSRIIIDTDAFNTFHPYTSVNVYGEKDFPLEMTDDLRLVTTPMLHGYSLKDKEWLRFYLDLSKEIIWETRAFEALVLPSDQENLKDLILAFAKAQAKQVNNFDDVVEGKGRGIIMQLSGPPGVGKTLTAESVAEVMRVPLYAMSAGDLGTSASDVEYNLKQARSATDLERNELVSIFLRLLEYYEGIMFLTTNRSENIDPAFESRVHVSLTYQDLDKSARRHIWTQFLSHSANVGEFSDDVLNKLSEVQLNGRQIKNLVKTASLLAWSKEENLKYEHVQTVLRLRDVNS
ncbi:hypothetical protein N7468_006850 [Penicillium chermesinum]|uniref:ATPase AAA-type core domain-containing protein n=1 Tax=Penicillium chermesinum TaxID=63820 RepID=A0A9W9NT54_9EURO|nr:uncharacterized protein N7468_006850 [Penicillium chermesinum]KAJ5225625.1 hypothetical protein N7468_006850 [Penicillium chermesinum]